MREVFCIGWWVGECVGFVFSSRRRHTRCSRDWSSDVCSSDLTARGGPSLGRKVAPGQEQNDPAKTVTPLLSANVNRGDVGSGSQVTPEEVGGTSPRYNGTPRLPSGNAAPLEKPSPGRSRGSGEYALKNVDF